MAIELPAYAIICGLIYLCFKKKNLIAIYVSLISAMLGGRVVYAIVQSFILGLGEDGFTLSIFIAKAFVRPFPGIILQLILIPSIPKAFASATKSVALCGSVCEKRLP